MTAKIDTLDGLRGLAVLLVISLHFGYVNAGWIGVQVFFVLSGYLITGILLSARDAPLGAYAGWFYGRRALRIFPLYFLYLAVLAAASATWREVPGLHENLPELLTYTYNFTRWSPTWEVSPFFTHFWSLAVEEQFYVVWPFVVYALPATRLRVVALALLALGPLTRWALGLVGSGGRDAYALGDAIYWFPLSHADAFAVGALVAVTPVATRIRRPAIVAAVALALVAAAGAWQLRALTRAGLKLPLNSLGYPLAGIENAQHVWSYTVLNLAAAAWVAAAVAAAMRGGVLRALLGNRVLAGLGRISYGVYVIHWPVLALFNAQVRYRALTLRGYRMFALYLAIVVGLAWVLHRAFEARFLALKDRLPLPAPALPAGDAALLGERRRLLATLEAVPRTLTGALRAGGPAPAWAPGPLPASP